ncbi:Uncaracterized surface protein containing fasciclin (FAS1) repeats [Devosia enhydra]|uniref:Uncaracterized surface protein containing fasciclin (FAS1) repeats n=1 Tax=Devosia enhydra TaxID=665118 RepID=A0A1K2I1F7_9HYPH|nr:fasciclin domain-containing protein [Devosia enhydra]SFZ86161.1 Uncaracterized surface protein containing fasciclin (FAS1) repeats [Devosia enhydra]
MKLLKTLALATALVASPLALTSVQAANVVETAQAAGSFQTLLAAATAAGLADALATTANITVFAPTDEAFAALPAGTVENLLKPENQAQLVAILQLHVVPSEIMSAAIPDGATEVDTLNPEGKLTVTKSGAGVTVAASNTANVVTADVDADNGVIHVIDAVLLP